MSNRIKSAYKTIQICAHSENKYSNLHCTKIVFKFEIDVFRYRTTEICKQSEKSRGVDLGHFAKIHTVAEDVTKSCVGNNKSLQL